jgi:Kef-type K+ transport system membrane component KefB
MIAFAILSQLPLAAATPASGAATAGISQADPVVPILLAIVFIIFAAMLGGLVMRRVGQPAVLGELLVGMVVANVAYALHSPVLTVLRAGPVILNIVDSTLTHAVTLQQAAQHILLPSESSRRVIEVLGGPHAVAAVTVYQFVDQISRIAIMFLLFLVGLETSLREMRRVGWLSLGVTLVGVTCSWACGFLVMSWIDPAAGFAAHLFVGGILTATSVAISVRVFRDIRQSTSPEARIVLGASVIDDVLGLIILAVTSGLVATGIVNVSLAASITARAALFLVAAIGIGVWLAPRILKRLHRYRIANLYMLFGLGLAFVYAWLATRFDLATIIGAFAAGLVLEDFFKHGIEQPEALREILSRLEALIVPIYFVLIGMQVKFEAFTNPSTLWAAAGLTVAAVLGKFLSGTVCLRRCRWLVVSVAMIPRGEVSLIFASLGRSLGVVSDAVFAAVVAMVMITTFVAPPLLKLAYRSAPQAS